MTAMRHIGRAELARHIADTTRPAGVNRWHIAERVLTVVIAVILFAMVAVAFSLRG